VVSFVSRASALLFGCACVGLFGTAIARADDTIADVDAAARSAGNRPAIARRVGDAIFAATWPAQVTKVRVDAAGSHAVAGLVLSGVKFHRSLDRSGFLDEIASLVATTFAHSDVEEVDVWATVPVPTHKHEVVAGDLAMPTSHIVFAVTAKRADGRAFVTRLRAGRDVYWDQGWSTTLASR
jgi:hypothetical protein